VLGLDCTYQALSQQPHRASATRYPQIGMAAATKVRLLATSKEKQQKQRSTLSVREEEEGVRQPWGVSGGRREVEGACCLFPGEV